MSISISPLYKCQDQWICTKFAASCILCKARKRASFSQRVEGGNCAHGARENIFFWIWTSFLPSNWDVCETLIFNLIKVLWAHLVTDHWASGAVASVAEILLLQCRVSALNFPVYTNLELWLRNLLSMAQRRITVTQEVGWAWPWHWQRSPHLCSGVGPEWGLGTETNSASTALRQRWGD